MNRSAGAMLCLLFFLSGAMTTAADGSLLRIDVEATAHPGDRITDVLLDGRF
ncbi:MAG: hypothetical protein KF780_10425 [Sphingomonas sp.]|nr:hypothetical protein [Sphingomonas sp.]